MIHVYIYDSSMRPGFSKTTHFVGTLFSSSVDSLFIIQFSIYEVFFVRPNYLIIIYIIIIILYYYHFHFRNREVSQNNFYYIYPFFQPIATLGAHQIQAKVYIMTVAV